MKKKNFKPFILWLILFIAGDILVSFLIGSLSLGSDITVKIFMAYIVIAMDLCMVLIHFGDYAYYFTGHPTYEEAANATKEYRHSYTLAHLKRFLIVTIPILVFYVISYFLNLGMAIDIILTTLGIAGAAISTMNIKWENNK